MSYQYPAFEFGFTVYKDGFEVYTLLANGARKLPHGGWCQITCRPGNAGWGEMVTSNGPKSSMRYSCVPPEQVDRAQSDAIKWAKRKFREWVRATQATAPPSTN